MSLTLKLMIDGEEKEFKQPSTLYALRFKQAVQWAIQLEKDFSVESLEGAVEFIANDLYASQFTAEDFWNGLLVEDFVEVIRENLSSPMQRMHSKMEPLKK